MAMATPSVGDWLPLVTTPMGAGSPMVVGSPERTTAYPPRAMPRAPQDETDEPFVRSGLVGGGECVTAHELVVEHDGPAQAGLEGRDIAVELMTVQWHARLQPQRVTGTKAARLQSCCGAGSGERDPQRGSLVPGDEQLETVLAGVAGASH